MRLLFAAMALIWLSYTPASALNCEILSIRNASGDVTATKRVCVDANGAWVDPATVDQTSEPEPNVLWPTESEVTTFSPPPPLEIQPTPQIEGWSQPVFSAPQPVAPAPAPIIEYAAEPAPLDSPEQSLAISTPFAARPPALLDKSDAWQPTSGVEKRQQLYAKLGLACVARDARFCTNGSCSGLCSGKHGWCDGKTGELYASLEAIERVYCRKLKRR